jgi:hypothetical protein
VHRLAEIKTLRPSLPGIPSFALISRAGWDASGFFYEHPVCEHPIYEHEHPIYEHPVLGERNIRS